MKYLLIPLLLISLNAFAGASTTGYYQYHPDTDRWSYGTKDKKTGKKTKMKVIPFFQGTVEYQAAVNKNSVLVV